MGVMPPWGPWSIGHERQGRKTVERDLPFFGSFGTTLAVRAADNRGTKEVPYGYVYFNDDSTRLGYMPSQAGRLGVRSLEWYGLFESNWDGATEEHFEVAKAYFDKHGYPDPTN